ncbi:MAG TPA: hypothetical protein VJN67_14155 [Stellaceae bacterium]|nr:hypothetical protein [Stellaceae bacterium]
MIFLASAPRGIIQAWTALMIGLLVPLGVTPIVPSNDLFFHTARMFVLQHPDTPYARNWYQADWAVMPNLAIDIIVPPLASLVGTLPAVNAFVGLTLFLTFSGVLALHYALYGRLSWLPLGACLFIYNQVLFFGFLNYLFGIGLALWALAAWFYFEDRSSAQILTGVVLAVLLYLSHLFAVVLYGLVIGTAELPALWRARSVRLALQRVAAVATPFIVPLLLLLSSRTLDQAKVTIDYFPDSYFILKVLAFFSPFVSNYPAYDIWLSLGTVVIAIFGLATRMIRVKREMRLVLVLMPLLVMAIPTSFMGTYLADFRLPIAAIFLAFAACRFEVTSPTLRIAFAGAVACVFLFRVSGLAIDFGVAGREAADIGRAFDSLRPGSVLFTGTFDHTPLAFSNLMPDRWLGLTARRNTLPLGQFSTTALLHQPVFVPETLMTPGQQPTRMLEPYRRLKSLQSDAVHPWSGDDAHWLDDQQDLERWVARIRDQASCPEYRFTAIYVVLVDPLDVVTAPKGARVLYHQNGYWICDITSAEPAPECRA